MAHPAPHIDPSRGSDERRNMMKKRLFAATLVLVLVLGLLSGCGKKPSQTADASKRAAANEICIGIAQDFDSLDPDYMTAAGTKEVLFNVFEGLVKPNADGEIVPAVASEIAKSDDGLTYTFTLREGVKFHSGDPVTMQDVVYSLERRWKNDDSAAHLAALEVISSLDAGDNVLTITLSAPSNEFLAAVMNAYIIPADYAAQETAPVGTGPYKFVSRQVQDSMVLERFDNYWGTPGKLQ